MTEDLMSCNGTLICRIQKSFSKPSGSFSNCDYNMIVNNTFRNIGVAPYIQTQGAHTKVAGNIGFNARGLVSVPFDNAGANTFNIGALGGSAVPFSGTDYLIAGGDILLTSISGNGANITIKESGGTVILSGVTTLSRQYVPFGYIVNWGTFTSSPTVQVFGT
jgi:hypothetical protein